MLLPGSVVDMAPEMKSEFEHWHSHEHFPERLGVPDSGGRPADECSEGEGIFVMYELTSYAILSSDAMSSSEHACHGPCG
jgi:hypothetical protein